MKKKLILISSKAITINTFLDQLLFDLKKNFETKILVADPRNISVNGSAFKIDLNIKLRDFFNIFKICKCLFKIRHMLIKEKDSEIFVHTPLAAHMVRLALLFTQKKIVYFVHGFRFHMGSNYFLYKLFSLIEILLKNKTKYYFVINNEDKTYVKNILKKKFYFLNGIGINLKKKTNRFNSKKKIFRVGVVSAYRENKGYDDLFSVVEKIKSEQVEFHCYGYGDNKVYLKKIKKLGLEAKIKLFSFKKNIEKYYYNFDLFFHPSLREGLPISVLQSLYFGVPVIGRDIRGLNDLVISNKHGYLIKYDFVNNSIKLIKKLIKNPKKINSFKKNISKINFRKYSKKKISKEIIEHLKNNYEI